MGGDRWRGLRLLHGEARITGNGTVRLPLPVAAQLGAEAVLSPARESALCLYPRRVWDRELESLETLPDVRSEARLMVQLMKSNAITADISDGCEVHIPPALCRLGNLSDVVVIVSAGDHAELWNPALWSRHELTDGLRYGVA